MKMTKNPTTQMKQKATKETKSKLSKSEEQWTWRVQDE